jgi:hypothetical protein
MLSLSPPVVSDALVSAAVVFVGSMVVSLVPPPVGVSVDAED